MDVAPTSGSPAPEETAGRSIASLRFLIAEDHDFQRDQLARTLTDLGAVTIHQATDGRAALAILHDSALPVDIVISDLDMAGMDGMEFVRHVGENEVPVSLIIASAVERKLLASIGVMSEAYGIKLLGVIEKPLTARKLAPLIRRFQEQQMRADRVAAPIFTLDEIRVGLQHDQFEPFFQPKVALATGDVRGAEALARWRHPDLGFIAPAAFIQPLEDAGLIDDLTWRILRKAAATCSAWRAAGTDATVSVNLSPRSLGSVAIAEHVTALVREQQLDPQHVVIEVTESAATTEVGKSLENLARLRMNGFGLSIDDYGTGYSSMQQLTRIAFTEFKIDRSFVTNASSNNSVRVILESSLKMARKLNITSVAEGVESLADHDLLCKLRCDMAQGYYIARPMETAAFMDWLQENHSALRC